MLPGIRIMDILQNYGFVRTTGWLSMTHLDELGIKTAEVSKAHERVRDMLIVVEEILTLGNLPNRELLEQLSEAAYALKLRWGEVCWEILATSCWRQL